MKFLLLFMLPALAAAGSSIRDVCLPPWYDQAAFQRVELELEDLAANYVQLDHPCTIFCTNQVVNGRIDFVDPDAATNPARFYRTVPEAGPPLQ